jgi:hypothetical protein
MEIVKSKKINLVVVLFSILFLLFGGCAFAQVEREASYHPIFKKNVTTRYNAYALEFESPLNKKDRILLNIKSDSLSTTEITFDIFVYFPSNINPKGSNIVIGYEDGTTDVFHQQRFDSEDNYTEYSSIGGINNISKKKVAYVVFRGIAKCVNKDKTYFTNFFKYI